MSILERSKTPSGRRVREEDGPYNPDEEDNPNPNVTPNKRRKTASSLATSAKNRTRFAINTILQKQYPLGVELPQRPICVITGETDDMNPIEFSHVVAKAVDDETLTKLEWAWGMRYWSLNVDTHFNLQTLSVAVHRFFDRQENGWFWLPELNILSNFLKTYRADIHRFDVKKACFSPSYTGGTQANLPIQLYKNKQSFKYRFVATQGMKSCCAIRRYHGSYTSVDPLAFKQHVYPFPELPQFELNILPHFVIFDTGRKLDKILGGSTSFDGIYSNFDLPVIMDGLGAMFACLDLYRLWMSGSPSDDFTNSLDSSQAPSQTSNHDSSPKSGTGRSTRTSQRTRHSRASAPEENPDDSAGDELSPDDSASNMDDPVDYDEREEEEDWTDDDEAKLMREIEEWAEDVWRHSLLDSDEDSASNSSTGGMTLVDPSDEQPSVDKIPIVVDSEGEPHQVKASAFGDHMSKSLPIDGTFTIDPLESCTNGE
ncbi:hypothetical protein PC9H_002525 [Pleurotus ostreatus]|uniref:HNH nuclease domain-containing protein n=1 Tax=Pleurotus ostreatus TaxID=5322 RepID=A0A8H6ZGX7_PLEOS|nr:uncharacterized protein PC9H_002525 [Pleurotus ostreatus]KAF7416260.1 hypothetical protein PC9H_002525 [Pleurotus ostreatus]